MVGHSIRGLPDKKWDAGDVAFADEEVLFGGLDGQHGLGIRRGGAGVPGGVERWGPGDLHVWLASSILYA